MRRTGTWAWALVFALMVVTAVYNVFALQYRLGGYDLSAMIDAAWRVRQGQVPNRDFVCVFPPSLYLLGAAAFRVMGVRWVALSVMSSVFSVVVAGLGLRLVWLMRRVVGERRAVLAGLAYCLALMVPLLVVGHLWHSAMAQSLASYALLASFTWMRLKRAGEEHRGEMVAHLSLATGALLLSKPNLAGPTLLLCAVALLWSGVRWWVVVPAVGGVVLASLLLLPAHTTLWRTAEVYAQLQGRFWSNTLLEGFLVDPGVDAGQEWLLVAIPVAPVLWVMGRGMVQRRREGLTGPALLLAVAGVVVTLVGLETDAEFRIVETPTLLVGGTILYLGTAAAARWAWQPVLRGAVSLVAVATFLSATRARMQAVGSWAEDTCGARVDFGDRFFGDFHACALFRTVLRESDAAVRAHAGARVFFGPRLEFNYAREGLRSPAHLPMWWHPGTSYPLLMEGAVVRAWEEDRFDLLVFGKGDRTRLPEAVLRDVAADYVQLPGTEATDVYVRRGAERR